MAGRAAAGLHLHAEGREIQLVMEDGEAAGVDLVEARRLRDGAATRS